MHRNYLGESDQTPVGCFIQQGEREGSYPSWMFYSAESERSDHGWIFYERERARDQTTVGCFVHQPESLLKVPPLPLFSQNGSSCTKILFNPFTCTCLSFFFNILNCINKTKLIRITHCIQDNRPLHYKLDKPQHQSYQKLSTDHCT